MQLEGRIMKAAGGAYEITDARGTQLVATPAFWDRATDVVHEPQCLSDFGDPEDLGPPG